MVKVNLALWIVSLTLQCILFWALIRRGIARTLPIFTVIIAFYVLRSISLYAFSGRLRGNSYDLVLSSLALVDVALQTAVAWEMFSSGVGFAHWPGRTTQINLKPVRSVRIAPLWRLATFCVLVAVAVGIAAILSTLIHASPRMPVDRSILFNSMLFILVFCVAMVQKAPTLVRRVATGFALYAGVSILAQIGHTLAAAGQDTVAYIGWSYADAGVYVAVILFWIVALPRPTSAAFHTPDRVSGESVEAIET